MVYHCRTADTNTKWGLLEMKLGSLQAILSRQYLFIQDYVIQDLRRSFLRF